MTFIKEYDTEEELEARKEEIRAYQREYHRRRRQNDPEFRERHLKSVSDYQKRARGKDIPKKEPGRPAVLTPEQKMEIEMRRRQRASKRVMERYREDPEFKKYRDEISLSWYYRNKSDPEFMAKRREQNKAYRERLKLRQQKEKDDGHNK